MKRPRLSITVLNYNYGHYLGECLRSIMAQSYVDFEVIVIDDCSSDDSLRVIEPFLQDPRVRLINHPQNAGFLRSLIEGVEASSSPYMCVVSADDFVLSPRAFEQQMRLLEQNPQATFCYGSWVLVDAKSESVVDVAPFPKDHVWSGEEEFRQMCTSYHVLHSGTIIRRSAYEAVGGYPTDRRYTVDWTMWAVLCGAGDVAYVAEPLYGYRIHGSNMSRRPEVLRATTDEMVSMVEVGFASLPEGRVKSDRRLHRRAHQKALATVASMEIFADRRLSGWRTFAYAVRLDPLGAVSQRLFVSFVAHTLLGARGLQWLRSLKGSPAARNRDRRQTVISGR
jgi:glycosyl transferase family 2